MTEPRVPDLALRDFQREAVEVFFNQAARVSLLVAPIGSGKGGTASAIVAESFRRGAQSVVVLSARNVVAQGIAWRSSAGDLRPFELHRALPPGNVTEFRPRWPARALAFGSFRQAARGPLLDALRAREWDLLVLDLSGAGDDRLDEARTLLDEIPSHRVLALDDVRLGSARWSWLGATRLPYAVAINTDRPADVPVRFSVVNFERSQEEIALAQRAQELAIRIRGLHLPSKARLSAAVASSPVAAQSQAWASADGLRHVRNRLAHGLASVAGTPGVEALGPEALPDLDQLLDALHQFGDDFELVASDSKWEAFTAAFRERAPDRALIFCDFAETVVYVTDRLQALGVQAVAVQDATALAEAQTTSIQVIRDDKLPGLEFPGCPLAFNYDLPASPRRAHIRWSRLDLSGHTAPAMVTLVDKQSATPTERMALVQFRYLVEDG